MDRNYLGMGENIMNKAAQLLLDLQSEDIEIKLNADSKAGVVVGIYNGICVIRGDDDFNPFIG